MPLKSPTAISLGQSFFFLIFVYLAASGLGS